MAQILRANTSVTCRVIQLSSETGLLCCHDVLEYVAFGNDVAAGIDFEGVSAVGVEVVVYGMEEGVSGDFGGAARGVVDVVLLEGDKV